MDKCIECSKVENLFGTITHKCPWCHAAERSKRDDATISTLPEVPRPKRVTVVFP